MVNDKNNNSGNRNSGDINSGNWNSGDINSGNWNSGNRNSGDMNSGYRNSGNWNSGNRNSGDMNSGNWNSGFFNTNEPNVRLFNKETNLKRSDIDIPCVNLKTTEWISEVRMTDKQKKENPNFYITKGILIKRSYKEAWKLYWSEIDQETKERFLNLPNFDAKIFEEITGINIKKKETCDGKVVEIEGKKYKLTELD